MFQLDSSTPSTISRPSSIYVSLSLATTLRDDIDVRIRDVEEMVVFLN
ncbi:MAG: hypothetical protein ACKVUS_22425 [Saprospiraceae bacterium]